MARATTAEAARRRREVDELACRGLGAWAISRALRCDHRTVQRDLVALAAARRAAVDVEAERARLLEGARLVESTAWKLYAAAGASEAVRLGALAKVLAGQAQALTVLREIAGTDLEHRVGQLEGQLEALAVARRGGPQGAPRTNGHVPGGVAAGGRPPWARP
jgi:hypothetical protein